MNILITGANFYNKGAELMLVSLVDALRTHFPIAKLYVSPLLGDIEKARELDLEVIDFPLFHYGQKPFPIALNYPYLYKLYRTIKKKKLIRGDIKLKNIDYVFDISGYAFGEKWGPRPLHDLKMLTRKIKDNGGKFFLLPQAFGPFGDEQMSRDVQEIVNNVQLLIARDAQSLRFVESSLETASDKVHLFPDITLTFEKYDDSENTSFGSAYCTIVPNERMLDKASKAWQMKYIEVMANMIVDIAKGSNLAIVLLIHAQGDSYDAEVGKMIIQNIPEELHHRVIYYVETDPVKLKAIISKSQFLIGSRFHALASALSSGVPAIGTSWLHKYEMLFEDYSCKEFSFNEPTDEIFLRVQDLLVETKRLEVIDRLKKVNTKVKAKNMLMWEKIRLKMQ